MKRFLKSFALMMAAVIGAVSCSEAEIDDALTIPDGSGITLYASAGVAETKVTFAENDADGIDLAWELGDTFTLYETETYNEVGIFECTDIETGAFTSQNSDLILDLGMTYDAYYNLSVLADNISEQNGDEINNLNAACEMKATFRYDGETATTIAFEHTMAIMTFQFESAERPAKLEFQNGDEVYTVTYINIAPVNNLYTSHIMIAPCEAEERTLTFTLYDSEDTAYDIRTVTTDKAYVAGYRYTAPVSNLDPTIWLGSGTESDPYQITTADQLRLLSTNVNTGTTYEGEYFVMTNDIDLGGIDAEGNGIAENEFTAIGYWTSSSDKSDFYGNFDGGGYEVSGLYINQPESGYQGLFGCTDCATIKNVGVSGSVTGKSSIGGVVGYAYYSEIINCYNRATISGSGYYIGGVVGIAVGSSTMAAIKNCYNTGSVSNNGEGDDYHGIGGIVGYIGTAKVINCYNTGAIEASCKRVGGVAGTIVMARVINCYNAGSVSGSDSVGGVAGYCSSPTAIENCYFNSDDFSGDAIGYTSSTSNITNVNGYSTNYMKNSEFVTLLNNGAYSYNNANSPTVKASAWVTVSDDYPMFDLDGTPSYTDFYSCTANGSGTSSDPYLITNNYQMRDLSTKVNNGTTYSGVHFKMMCDIELGGSSNEFTAIGSSSSIYFGGTFDGNGFEISGLYINQSEVSRQGLFGYIYKATIKNLGVDGSVSGRSYTGGIVGTNYYSTISCCYNKATVSGSIYIGGVVGYMRTATISYCYNQANISGTYNDVGGVVGHSYAATFSSVGYGETYGDSYVTSCYNRGSISCSDTSASANVGGVIGGTSVGSYAWGYNYEEINYITNCYNSGNVSGVLIGGILGRYYICVDLTYSYSCIGGIYGTYNGTSDFCTQSNNATYTSDEMQESTFVDLLNSRTAGVWKQDTNGINDGYPILSWQ